MTGIPSRFPAKGFRIVPSCVGRISTIIALLVALKSMSYAAPSIGSFKLNDGRSATTLPTVILFHEWSVEEPTEFRASEMEDLSDATWQPYELKPSFTVSSELGSKTVYFQVRNGNGESEILNDSIELDKSSNPESVEISRILAKDTNDYVQFGRKLAVSGDTLVVSAPNDEEFGRRAGAVYVFVRDGDNWVQQAKLVPENVEPSNNVGFGLDIDGDTVVIGSNTHVDDVVRSGIAHVFVRESGVWSQEATLLPSDGESGDGFGISLAIDGNTIVCSAASKNLVQGAAYVFVRNSGGVWSEQSKLTASDGLNRDGFGRSVDVDGDTIVIGAAEDRINGVETGSAYVFERSGDSWTETTKLLPEDLEYRVSFGFEVAVLEDTIAVSSIYDGAGPLLTTGSVQLFNRASGDWTRGAKLKASDSEALDRFGWGLNMSPAKVFVASWDVRELEGAVYQFDQIGNSWTQTAKYLSDFGRFEFEDDRFGEDIAYANGHLFVGAYRNVNGAVFHFDSSGGASIIQSPGVSILPSMTVDEGENATFSAVSFGTLPVEYQWQRSTDQGETWSDIEGATGSSYTFENVTQESSEDLIRVEATNAVGSNVSDSLSFSVNEPFVPTISNFRLNNDDPTTVIRQVTTGFNGTSAEEFRIGEVADLSGVEWQPYSGILYRTYTLSEGFGEKTVYFQTRTTAGESEILNDSISLEPPDGEMPYQKLFASDRMVRDYFGQSIALSGDFAFVGGPNRDGSGEDSGKVYVFENQEGGWVEVAELVPSDIAKRDFFGTSVAVDGNTLAIGSPGDDSAGDDSGSVYIFTRVEDDWVQQEELTNLDSVSEDRFGFRVALQGDGLVVGAPDHSKRERGIGAVYVFERENGSWSQNAKLVPGDDVRTFDFGSALSVDGDRILVGGQDPNGSGSGSAFMFVQEDGVWKREAVFVPENSGGGERWGSSVALFGDLVAIGAPKNGVFDDFRFIDFPSGSVFIYQRSGSDWTLVDTIDSVPDDSGEFGASVALVEDLLVIGEPEGKPDLVPSGIVYVYDRDADEGWKLRSKLSPRDLGSDRFGGSVTVFGTNILVGADEDDSRAGSAYIFDATRPPEPEFMEIAVQEVNELETLTFPLLVSDPLVPATSVTFEFISSPMGATIDPQTGEFSWTPSEDQGPGMYEFSLRASNDFESDTVSFSVSVLAVFDSFEGWQEDFLPAGATEEQLAFDSDLDFDMQNSLIEFAAGSDPLLPDLFNPIRLYWDSEVSVTEIDLHARTGIEGLSISVDLGTDLSEWDSADLLFDSQTQSWTTDASNLTIESSQELESGIWLIKLLETSERRVLFVRLGVESKDSP